MPRHLTENDSLAGFADVDLTGLTDGDVLTYDATLGLIRPMAPPSGGGGTPKIVWDPAAVIEEGKAPIEGTFSPGLALVQATVTGYKPDPVWVIQGDSSSTSEISWTVTVTVADWAVVSFWVYSEGEANYDFTRFLIDGVQMGAWSGAVAWRRVDFALAPGTRTLKWTWRGDGGSSIGRIAGIQGHYFPASAENLASPRTLDFESGVLDPDLQTTQWAITTRSPIAGTRSLGSNAPGSGNQNRAVTYGPLPENGAVEFMWKVGSESRYDFFRVEVGGWQVLAASGVASGTTRYIVPKGSSIVWRYTSDGGGMHNGDEAFIDGVLLPFNLP